MCSLLYIIYETNLICAIFRQNAVAAEQIKPKEDRTSYDNTVNKALLGMINPLAHTTKSCTARLRFICELFDLYVYAHIFCNSPSALLGRIKPGAWYKLEAREDSDTYGVEFFTQDSLRSGFVGLEVLETRFAVSHHSHVSTWHVSHGANPHAPINSPLPSMCTILRRMPMNYNRKGINYISPMHKLRWPLREMRWTPGCPSSRHGYRSYTKSRYNLDNYIKRHVDRVIFSLLTRTHEYLITLHALRTQIFFRIEKTD